jgi:hypothetical protein
VHLSSKNPTPELPLLEEAASELAAYDELDLLPAAALDVECAHAAQATPPTTLPATPFEEDSCSSCGSDGPDFTPLFPNESPLRVCEKNTFLDLKGKKVGDCALRTRSMSDFTGLRNLKEGGVTEVPISSLRLPEILQTQQTSQVSFTSVPEELVLQDGECVPMWCRIQCANGAMCVTPVAGGDEHNPPGAIDHGSWGRLWCYVQVRETGTLVVPCTDKCMEDINKIDGSYPTLAPSQAVEDVAMQLLHEETYNPPWEAGPYWPFNAAPTTLVLGNLPDELTQEDLLEILDRESLSGLYDFVYLPDNTNKHERYALVNVTQHEFGLIVAARFHGKSSWGVCDGTRACNVTWSLSTQGIADLVLVYRDSAENQPDVPEDLRPQLFSGGWPVPFLPSKTVSSAP